MPDSPPTVLEAAERLLECFPAKPSIALILGSGLGDFASELEGSIVVPGDEVPHYPPSTVSGHRGRIVFGRVSDQGSTSPPLLVFQGRIHFYETGDLEPVLFPTRLAYALGVRTLFVTNAAGGINQAFKPGDLMLITDIIHFTGLSLPLPSGSSRHLPVLFDPNLKALILRHSVGAGVRLHEGTYCWLKGPSYETAAEIRMFARCGVDAVGMSTVPELMLASRLGMRTAGISLISNLATGITASKLTHTEVTETASRVQKQFSALLRSTLATLSQDHPA